MAYVLMKVSGRKFVFLQIEYELIASNKISINCLVQSRFSFPGNMVPPAEGFESRKICH